MENFEKLLKLNVSDKVEEKAGLKYLSWSFAWGEFKKISQICGSRTVGIKGELLQLENPYHCPHGRPTIIKFTIYDLEKMFKRAMN